MLNFRKIYNPSCVCGCDSGGYHGSGRGGHHSGGRGHGYRDGGDYHYSYSSDCCVVC